MTQVASATGALLSGGAAVWALYTGTDYLLEGRTLGCVLHWAGVLGFSDLSLRLLSVARRG